jgi:hypothetical protein
MSTYISLDKEEYDRLIRTQRLAQEQTRTLDMILDYLKDNANTFDSETCYISTLYRPEYLANIFRYRMPEEWQEMEIEVIEREKRKAKDEDDAES